MMTQAHIQVIIMMIIMIRLLITIHGKFLLFLPLDYQCVVINSTSIVYYTAFCLASKSPAALPNQHGAPENLRARITIH